MSALVTAAIAPVLICLFYIYVRDKYEKEPWRLLTVGVVLGAVILFPIIQAENFMTGLMPLTGATGEALYTSFAVAAFVEESFKFVLLFALTWRNRNLNEPFDGIVYSSFISLGFAGAENILYVINPDLGGMGTALTRAFVSVPAHGVFGVMMGYYFVMAALSGNRAANLAKAYLYTTILHGLFDFPLLAGFPLAWAFFAPLFAWMGFRAAKQMRLHSEASPFKTDAGN
jgi:RsiW-degrading membrane proteinase PrsW (M82 family)